MNSLWYGLSFVAILVIIHWYILNDGKGQDDGSLGLLAMSPHVATPPAKEKSTTKRSFRRNA